MTIQERNSNGGTPTKTKNRKVDVLWEVEKRKGIGGGIGVFWTTTETGGRDTSGWELSNPAFRGEKTMVGQKKYGEGRNKKKRSR